MKNIVLFAALCTLSGCVHGQIPPQVEEVYTCITPVMDATYLTLKEDVAKVLNNEKAEWAKDLGALVKKHGLQTISCIVEVFLHPSPAPMLTVVDPLNPPKVNVAARAKEFLDEHKITFNK